MFQLPLSSGGRLMPVCQSTFVWNVSQNKTCRSTVSPGAMTSGIRNSCRARVKTSSAEKLFAHVQRPIWIGVANERLVLRSVLKSGRVRTGAVSPGKAGVTSEPAAVWKFCTFEKAKPGDQVIDRASVTTRGARLILGSV